MPSVSNFWISNLICHSSTSGVEKSRVSIIGLSKVVQGGTLNLLVVYLNSSIPFRLEFPHGDLQLCSATEFPIPDP